MLSHFGLNPKMGFKTTDNASNMKALGEDQIGCLAHILNLIQKGAFKAAMKKHKALKKMFRKGN